MKPIEEVTFGADPEFFVANLSGAPISVHNLISGTKDEPHEVENGAIQVDGVAAEFNILPTNVEETFVHRIMSVMSDLQRRIALKAPESTTKLVPLVHFDHSYFNSLPDHVKVLGCEPDYDAYTGKANPMPEPPVGVRTASGHIHIGWTDGADAFAPEHWEQCIAAVKQMDVVLGRTTMYFDRANAERQKYYGKLGAFRPKVYGVEYRSLSNVWLMHPDLTRYVYRMAKWGMQKLYEGDLLFEDGTLPLMDPYGLAGQLAERGAPRLPLGTINTLKLNQRVVL